MLIVLAKLWGAKEAFRILMLTLVPVKDVVMLQSSLTFSLSVDWLTDHPYSLYSNGFLQQPSCLFPF